MHRVRAQRPGSVVERQNARVRQRRDGALADSAERGEKTFVIRRARAGRSPSAVTRALRPLGGDLATARN